ncbi:MAG: hypothetical protein WCJ81_09025 [bacterium]
MKVKAEIKDYEGCLWLEINGKHDETAWAIKEDEIEPIMEACKKYLVDNVVDNLK